MCRYRQCPLLRSQYPPAQQRGMSAPDVKPISSIILSAVKLTVFYYLDPTSPTIPWGATLAGQDLPGIASAEAEG